MGMCTSNVSVAVLYLFPLTYLGAVLCGFIAFHTPMYIIYYTYMYISICVCDIYDKNDTETHFIFILLCV